MRAWADDRDQAWLVQMADGDRTALDEVLAAYGGEVLALVEHILGPSSEAEEVVQEVFLLLWRQAPSWPSRPALPLGAWLLEAARRNASLELQRNPDYIHFGRDVTLLPARLMPREVWSVRLRGAQPLQVARLQARRALASLRPSGRRMLALTLLRGATPAALGKLTGQPTRKARRLLVAALRHARETMWSRQEPLL